MQKVPCARLSNGSRMPLTGLFLSEIKNSSDHTKLCSAGFRHFKCDGDENLQEIMEKNKISRNDLYISATYKISNFGSVSVKKSLAKILGGLDLSFLDLFVLEMDVCDISQVSLLKTWKEMEEVCNLGLTRSVGLRNFDKPNLVRILQKSTVFPVVNQVLKKTKDVIECCHQYGILMCYVIDQFNFLSALNKPELIKIAESYNKTPLQIILRHLLDLNGAVLLDFDCSKYLDECTQIFDFHLAPESVSLIHDCVYN